LLKYKQNDIDYLSLYQSKWDFTFKIMPDFLQTTLISFFGMGIISDYIGPVLKFPVKMLLKLNFTHIPWIFSTPDTWILHILQKC